MNKGVMILVCLIAFSIFSCEEERVVDVKIMSYNIRHGEGMDTILNLSRIAHIIESQTPDICGLQEVDQFCSRTDSIGQTEYLSKETSMRGTFGKFMNYQSGEYGMATLTSMPLISTKILQLPDGKFESRTSIVHEVKITDRCTIAFANVHFDWIAGEDGVTNRLKQAQVLVKYLDTLKRASIITGDFNCTPDSPTMKYFAKEGFVFVQKGIDNLSFQGESRSEIDHLIYRDINDVIFKPKNIRLLVEPVASDHRPLIAELQVVF